MHYKNGREAKNGDKVLFLGAYQTPVIGILFDATAGNDTCNGSLATLPANGMTPNLAECLHVDDVKAALAGDVPDVSKA
jgi:hypothetical protein